MQAGTQTHAITIAWGYADAPWTFVVTGADTCVIKGSKYTATSRDGNMILLPGLGLDAAHGSWTPLGQTYTIGVPGLCASEPMPKCWIPTDLRTSSRSCHTLAGVNGRATLRSALPLLYFRKPNVWANSSSRHRGGMALGRRTKDFGQRQGLRATGRCSGSRPRPHSP